MMHPAAWVGAWVGLMGVSQAATGSLLAAVWQGFLLAAAAWLGLRLLPKAPASVRFAVWFGVFLLVAALPVIALWPRAGGSPHLGGSGAWLTLDSRWSVAIAAVWAAASLLRAATLAVAAFRLRALWKRAEPVELDLNSTPASPTPRPVISTEAQRSGQTCNSTASAISTIPRTVISTEAQRSGETCNSTASAISTIPRTVISTEAQRSGETCNSTASAISTIPTTLISTEAQRSGQTCIPRTVTSTEAQRSGETCIPRTFISTEAQGSGQTCIPRTVISTEAQRSGETCNCLAATLKIARLAQVCVSDEVDRPSVIGFFSPKILIPRWLLERLTPAELEQIVLHEAGHLRRADDWMNLLQKLALVVFPLNPALAWIERRLCFERELACDEQVLRDSTEQAGASTAYAACLVALAEYRMGRRGLTPGLALGFWGTLGRESELTQRVRRVLAGGGKMKSKHARLVLSVATAALLVGAVELPRCPQIVGFSAGPSLRATGPQFADRLEIDKAMAGFRAQSVVFRPRVGNGMLNLDPTHRDGAAMNGAQSGAGRKVTTHRVVTQTHVSDASPLRQAQVASEPSAGNWVVVTTWDGAGASRVVLTSAQAPDQAGTVREELVPAGDKVYEQRVYRYAAVPVRGGWLVIQL